MVVMVASQSCNTKVSDTEEPATIENTLQSVSYFQDTVGTDPAVLLKAFTEMNEAVDEIGYPDAGYKLIHNHQLYIDTRTANASVMDGLVSVKYYRFEKIK